MAYNSAINLDVTKSSTNFHISGASSKLVVSGDTQLLNDGSTILNGQILIGNSDTQTFNQGHIIAGTGISITSGAGALTIHATGGGLGSNPSYIDFVNNSNNPAFLEGRTFYDTVEKTLAFYCEQSGVTQNIGQEVWVRVANLASSGIANGSVVYITGNYSGIPAVALARAHTDTNSFAIGVATMNISGNTGIGYVTALGTVHSMNLSGFSQGAKLYLSDTVNGGLTATRPTGNNFVKAVGYVVTTGVSGDLFVMPSDHERSDDFYIPKQGNPFTKSAGLTNPDGISSGIYTIPVFRSNVNCVITGIHYNRIGGTGAVVFAYKNSLASANSHTAIPFSVSSTGTWLSTGSIANSGYGIGDALYLVISGVTGLPRALSVQVDFTQLY